MLLQIESFDETGLARVSYIQGVVAFSVDRRASQTKLEVLFAVDHTGNTAYHKVKDVTLVRAEKDNNIILDAWRA